MPRKLFILLCFCLALAPAVARAQSDQRLPGGDTVRWHRRAVDFVVDPTMFDGDTLRDPVAVVQRAAEAWRGNGYVPAFEVRVAPIGPVGYDASRQNVSGIALFKHNFPQHLDRAVLALTLLTRNSATGEIVDADIILDAERNRFAELPGPEQLGLPGAPNDYRNVITHEFGHVLGLVEDPEHPDATMFPSSQPGEVGKRELSAVDRESAARAYAEPPSLVDEVVGGCGGARVTPALGGTGALAWVALALLALNAWRSRRVRAVTVAMGALLLAAGAPSPRARTTRWGLVLRARVTSIDGVLHTRADVQTARGVVRVERVGGRLGALVQEAAHQPSGAALTPGATVTLSDE